MEKLIKEVTPDVIKAQKDAVVKEVATLEVQLGFMQANLTKREEGADEDLKASLAKERLQKIMPLKDNIQYKKDYYEYLCNLKSSATESVEEEKADATSKKH